MDYGSWVNDSRAFCFKIIFTEHEDGRIIRETKLLEQVSLPVEDDHEFVWVDYNELVDNMYLEMQSWALAQCMKEI